MNLDQAASDIARELGRLRWRSEFHKTLDNPDAPGGKVDMYMLVDSDDGEGLITIAVPHGHPEIAAYVADCCSKPWIIKTKKQLDDESVALAHDFNEAIRKRFGDEVHANQVAFASMVIFDAYASLLPREERVAIANKFSAAFQKVRDGKR